jgi:hypothetical protein
LKTREINTASSMANAVLSPWGGIYNSVNK